MLGAAWETPDSALGGDCNSRWNLLGGVAARKVVAGNDISKPLAAVSGVSTDSPRYCVCWVAGARTAAALRAAGAQRVAATAL